MGIHETVEQNKPTRSADLIERSVTEVKTVDQMGFIPRSTTTGLIWWSIRLSSLTEIDPSFSCREITVRVYTEARNGRRKMQSLQVDRLFGSVSIGKLPTGGRVSAAIGIVGSSGFTYVVSCNPILMPAGTVGVKQAGSGTWIGAVTSAGDLTKGKPDSRTLDLDRQGRGFVEHLPWEMPR